MRVAPEIILTDDERAELAKLVRSKLSSVRLAQRARIVLLAADGIQNKVIAQQLDVGRVQVSRWRERYAQSRLSGIERDLPRGAPPAKVDVARLVELTTQTKPKAATHWSTRTMGAELGVSAASVSRHWRANGLKPHVVRGFKVSRDSQFVEKLEDIVGLYMSPPEHTLVFCCDEKSQVQALDRTQPGLPLKKGRAETMTHDYDRRKSPWDKRNGTTTLFAALNVLDGRVIGQCQQRHTHAEWLTFLKKIDRETPKEKTLHLIADNYATHKHPVVQKWLVKHPRFNMHFTPTSASWMNMVERFFRDITTERLRRGVFTSVAELISAIDEYIALHNTKPKPFIWTKSARDILQKVIRANTRLSSKQNATLH
ncbi:MAG: IS630 family transposase [Propionivibrio sp.]|uniref:IS630 family transposase n=1 Tax=Propionivibrio sp. TaxID=2212460 RepID=UPI0025F8E74C|nr:IS630 family transposase [Propionivibrio sp.]MBL0208663.1 IS630 family transposase [Propionivibrio sp.]